MRPESDGKPDGKRPGVPDREDPQQGQPLVYYQRPEEWADRLADELIAAQADREAETEVWRRRWRAAGVILAWVAAIVGLLVALAGGFCLLVHSGILRG